jgi:cell wall-associated NlpC family hydrolase
MFNMKNAIRERKSKVLGLFLCFLLLGIDYSFASYNNYSQFKTLSVSMSNSTLREVLKTIEKSSQFVFFYLDDAVNLERKVSIDSKNKNIEEILSELFEGTSCTYRISDRQIFISGMSTQALLGMPVKVLQYNGWYEIQTPDDYTGWVHRMVITPMSKERYDEWNRAEKIVVTSHYGFAYEKPDESSQPVSDVVAGNRLKWEGSKGHFYQVSYPDGRKAYLSKSISQPEAEWRASLKQDVESIIETAYSMMGIPYLWAGTSSKGVDCSGLVRTVLFMHDIIIPRDASQQAYVGEHIDIAPDFSNVKRGDLVFFGRKATAERKEGISHVGIYLGNKQFIHALGDVHVSSMNPADQNYDEFNTKRLLFAVRFLPYINKEKGMNTTNKNPFYQ